MTETQPGTSPAERGRTPFPAMRLVYALLYGLIAWFTFWIALLLGALQFVALLVGGKVSEELRRASLNVIQYLWELLAYISFVRDEQPFPVGPFPSYATKLTP